MPDPVASQTQPSSTLSRSDRRFLRRWQRWHHRFWLYLVCQTIGSTLFYAFLSFLLTSYTTHGTQFSTWQLPGQQWLTSVCIWFVAVLVTRPSWYMDHEDRYQRLTTCPPA